MEEAAASSLRDSIAATDIEEVNIEEGAARAKVEVEDESPISLPHPLLVVQEEMSMPESSSRPTPQPDREAMATAVVTKEITITDQDVLFGRGGLTNRHIGNLRYRDIISIHRQDYVRAQKTEKPNVARRIVKAIRTGKIPGRFLRKGEDGKWHEVSDKEAAWKASQALREKSRWSSMKQDQEHPSNSHASAMVTPTAQKATQVSNAKTAEKVTKRNAPIEEPMSGKKVKSERSAELPPREDASVSVAKSVPTEISHITIPAVASLGDRRVGANYMLPAPSLNTNSTNIFPKEEDVLFGRGGRTNHHPGNKRLREIVNKYRDIYNRAKKIDKPKVSKLIVSALRNAEPPSRFLRMNEETTQWEDVGDKRAAEKVSQTLREKDRDAKAEYLAKKMMEGRETVERAAREAMSHTAAQQAMEEATTVEAEIAPGDMMSHTAAEARVQEAQVASPEKRLTMLI